MANQTVLIVDDDPGITDALSMVLEDEGYTPAVATNGEAALAYLRSHPPPRIVVLDLMMPVMDGYAFLAAQRGDPALASIPVVVATAGALDARAATADVVARMKKPLDLDALLALIARHG